MTTTTTESLTTPGTEVLGRGHSLATVTDKIGGLVLTRPFHLSWFVAMGLTSALVMMPGRAATTDLIEFRAGSPVTVMPIEAKFANPVSA